jgi:hypothetical protein
MQKAARNALVRIILCGSRRQTVALWLDLGAFGAIQL